MELDDLLKKEGLDAAGVEDALEWARDRAAELVRDMGGDPELGPLLEGAGPLPSPTQDGPVLEASEAGRIPAPPPMYSDLRGLQVAFLSEQDEEAAELPDVGAVLRVFEKARATDEASAATRAAQSPEPEPEPEPDGGAAEAAPVAAGDPAEDQPVPEPPEAELDPLAGIDFDDLPGIDDDEEEDDADHTHVDLPAPGGSLVQRLHEGNTMVPAASDASEMTLPSMQAPLTDATLTALLAEAGQPSGELTERARNPLLEAPVEAPAPFDGAPSPESPAPAEAPAMAIEPEEIELLDDDDLLLVEEEEEDDDVGTSVPEWKQALASAHDDAGAEPPAPPSDEGDDVDLGDL